MIDNIFQFAQSTPTAPRILGVHRRGTSGSRQVRQQPVAEHQASEKLHISVDAEVVG